MTTGQAAEQTSTVKFLGKALGALWLLDGLLQLQPKMFGMDFVNNVLLPNLTGQPALLYKLIYGGISAFARNTVFHNSLASLLQIAIGILLLFTAENKKFRAGLWLSVVWGLIVWVFGEGLGVLFTGSASLYSGAPGAALIYVLISIYLLWPEKFGKNFLTGAAAILLLLGSILQLQPMFWSMQMTFVMSAADPAHIISAVPTVMAAWLSAHLVLGNWITFILPLILAGGLWLKPNKTVAWLTILFLLLVWWLGQDFGGLSTIWIGTATDPNAAPLMMILVLPILFQGN